MLLRLLKLRPLQIFAYFSYPNYTKYMLITLYFSIKLRTAGHRLPGSAHTPRKLRCAAKILYEIMLTVFLCLTKPAFMRRPWRIKALPSRPWLGISVFHGIISTVSKPLRYSLTGSMCAATAGGDLRYLLFAKTQVLYCGFGIWQSTYRMWFISQSVRYLRIPMICSS